MLKGGAGHMILQSPAQLIERHLPQGLAKYRHASPPKFEELTLRRFGTSAIAPMDDAKFRVRMSNWPHSRGAGLS